MAGPKKNIAEKKTAGKNTTKKPQNIAGKNTKYG